MGRRALLVHTLELGLTRMPVYQSMCKEPLVTFEISSELQKSLSLLAFLNPGSASWSWACGKAAHSWADSSCSVSLLCDRPVQIELIAYEFPLACHIGRQIHTWFLTAFFPNLGQAKGTQRERSRSWNLSGLVCTLTEDLFASSVTPPTSLKSARASDSFWSMRSDQSENSQLPLHSSKYWVAKRPVGGKS